MALKCADYIQDLCSDVHSVRKSSLDDEYLREIASYRGSPLTNEFLRDVELIDSIMPDLKLGKAAGFDELASKHLKFCHSALVLTKLFNIILKMWSVP